VVPSPEDGCFRGGRYREALLLLAPRRRHRHSPPYISEPPQPEDFQTFHLTRLPLPSSGGVSSSLMEDHSTISKIGTVEGNARLPRLRLALCVVLIADGAAHAQIYSTGSAQCRVDASSGLINCSGQQTAYVQKPLSEVILESAALASSIERNRAIADAMRAQADLLRAQTQQQARASAMDRVISLLASAEKVEGEARETLLKAASAELRKLYPNTAFPPGATVLVPMSDDGWDRMACERMKTLLPNVYLFQGTFSDASSISGVKLLVVNMMPDANHDTMEAFLLDEHGQRLWAEKVGFAWTLNFERQTMKLSDRMVGKIKDRL
jgi:hypothetical protein